MATKTTTAPAPTENDSTSSLLDVEVEETVTGSGRRGRAPSEVGIAIQAELQKMATDRTARSFKNVTPEDREVWARKIRAAAKVLDIKVATRYDGQNQKLYWAPEDVMAELAAKTKG